MTTSNIALQSVTIIIFEVGKGRQRHLSILKSTLDEKTGRWFSYQVVNDSVVITSPCAVGTAQGPLCFSTSDTSVDISALPSVRGKKRGVIIFCLRGVE